MQDAADFDPPPGRPEEVAPGVRRVLCPNPSPFTFRGTNSYIIGRGAVAVVDPGPEDRGHLSALLGSLEPGERVTHILVTHAHRDHSPLAAALKAETGAEIVAFGDARAGQSEVMQRLAAAGDIGGGEGADEGFVPDRSVADGEVVQGPGWAVTALWTPGHFGNHLCFDMDGTVFSGDLVMGWASSLVSPPDGDLTDFMASCERLRGRPASIFLPGHGDVVRDPHDRLDWLISHRRSREGAILAALSAGPADAETLAARIYTDVPARMLPAATRNVLAHLIDLMGRDQVAPEGELHAGTVFRRLS